MKKIKVAFVRGRHLNNFELQYVTPLKNKINFTAFASVTTAEKQFAIRAQRLASPIDLVYFLGKFKVPIRYSLGILNRLFVDAQYLSGLEEKLKSFDIAHTADTYYHYTQQCLDAKKKGYVKKVVATIWENIPFNNEGIRGRRAFKQRANREIDLFIAMTQQAKETLIAEGVNLKKITVIYPGVDLTRFKPAKKIDSNMVQLLFVGRLVPEKGILTIYEAFKKIWAKHKNIHLTICGDGPLKQQIEELIENDKHGSIVTLLKTNYEAMPNLYQQADILLVASQTTQYWREQFGMVLIEAMASGLPIIATQSGAITEVVGNAGILVPEKNVEAYAHALEALITNKNLREKLAQKGLTRVKKYFNAQKTSKEILKCYKELLRDSE